MTKIKDIPIQERPIERLLQNGVENVSNEELLAIMLRTGSKKQSAKELAITILSKRNQISEFKDITYEELIKISGIGSSKAAILLSTIEFGKRMNRTIDVIKGKTFNHAHIIYEYYKDLLADKKQEYVYCIYLDNKKKIIKDKLLFIGTINYSTVHPREIYKEAYLCSASSIICIHNHPSGDVLPSKEDYMVTHNLKQVGEQLGIPLIDHIIIGKNKYYSFHENNDLT